MGDLNLTRPLAVGFALFALIGGVNAAVQEAQHGEKAIICTNPASGANWQIKVDYDRRTVDSHPADIGDAQISWHTADGENYALDRRSGHLTVTVASSTGGYFLHDQCKLDN
ncbi:MAG TPA: hypothetical protein VHX43_00775 [Xanthobacteraceae bacterium]|jgi:hypothetical protein|nr:hypothetical protein [Xanthobacteraceae bacterium]